MTNRALVEQAVQLIRADCAEPATVRAALAAAG
jgi:hypothetical protein